MCRGVHTFNGGLDMPPSVNKGCKVGELNSLFSISLVGLGDTELSENPVSTISEDVVSLGILNVDGDL